MHRESKWAVLALLVGLAMAAATIAPGASAKTSHCLVINPSTGLSYSTLQDGVNAASSGDTLWVRGTCTGDTTIDRDLTITGQQPKGFTAPRLNGRNVVNVGLTVTINALTIDNDIDVVERGGGIYNSGTLIVNNSEIGGNPVTAGSDPRGGGIYNDGGTVTLNSSVVDHNHAFGSTGGRGGGIYNNGGAVTLNNSSIRDNAAVADGGGIYNNGGAVTLTGSSTITGNSAGTFGGSYHGGGIYNNGGTLNGAVAGTGGNVYNNTPDDIYAPPPPVANNDGPYEMGRGETMSCFIINGLGCLLQNDTAGTAGDTLAVHSVNGSTANVGTQITLPSGALLTVTANGGITYCPCGAFPSGGHDSFTYNDIESNGLLSNTATVSLTID